MCHYSYHTVQHKTFDKLTTSSHSMTQVQSSLLWLTQLSCLFLFLPGLHSWFNFHHLVRHVYNTDGDLSRLWVALALQEVIDPGLQETAQLRLRQSCLGGRAHRAKRSLFWFDVFNDSRNKAKRKNNLIETIQQPLTARRSSDKRFKLYWPRGLTVVRD